MASAHLEAVSFWAGLRCIQLIGRAYRRWGKRMMVCTGCPLFLYAAQRNHLRAESSNSPVSKYRSTSFRWVEYQYIELRIRSWVTDRYPQWTVAVLLIKLPLPDAIQTEPVFAHITCWHAHQNFFHINTITCLGTTVRDPIAILKHPMCDIVYTRGGETSAREETESIQFLPVVTDLNCPIAFGRFQAKCLTVVASLLFKIKR